MSDINLTKAVRQNLLSLQNTAKQMATTQNRLSTGNKVNTALDNPSNFFTASSLNSRAGELSSLLDSMNNGVKTLEAADNGLTSITKTLESMQSTLRQARQDKTFQTTSYSLTSLDPNSGATNQLALSGGAFTGTTNLALTTTGSGQTSAMSAVYATPAASAATFTGTPNIDTAGNTAGTLNLTYGGTSVSINVGANLAAGGAGAALVTQLNTAIGSTSLNGKLTASEDATHHIILTAANNEDASIAVSGSAATSVFGAAPTAARGSDGKLSFTVNGAAVSLDATSGSTLTNAVANTNIALKAAGSKFQAYDDGANHLAIRAITTDAGALSIGGSDGELFGASATNTNLKLGLTTDELVANINNSTNYNTAIKASNDNGKLRIQNLSTQDLTVGGTNSSNQIIGTNTASTTIGGNTVRSGLADQFNTLRDQLDKLADDASFNGINLLRGDKLKITFNETGTSSIDIQVPGGKSVDTTQLGLPTMMQAKDLDADTGIDGLLDKVKTALNQVRSQSSTFGSNLSVVENRQNFTKNMMNTLQTGASNLTLADMNEEAANMVALQTRQSLATSSLSMANQADQNVLQLLR
ncbi:flagellin [Pleomorphomonas oryzae]|uniref:flagellin N-terminal helical domain-containing protein n=1 Tax=Pleomorphomonas oryzae TaxID=261934 RepID=UPI0004023793|nr:flagellin [Pleomorphomonas oryzae]